MRKLLSELLAGRSIAVTDGSISRLLSDLLAGLSIAVTDGSISRLAEVSAWRPEDEKIKEGFGLRLSTLEAKYSSTG